MRIGSVEDPDAGFSEIGGAAVDPDGLVYVLERRDRAVRVYDRSGQLVRTIGRSGEGPGEFRSPLLLGLLGDTLWVNDVGLRRLTFFSSDGTVLRVVSPRPTPIRAPGGLEVSLEVGVPRSSNLFSRVLIPENPPPDSFMIPIVHMDSTGAIVDTIYHRPWALGRRNIIAVGSGQIPLPRGTSASPLYVDAPNGRYVVEWSVPESQSVLCALGVLCVSKPFKRRAPHAHRERPSGGAVYIVTRIVGAADTLFRQTFRYQPRPYDEETVERLVTSAVAPFIASTGLDTAAVVAIVQREVELPIFQPPTTDGRVGQDTVLWLRSEGGAADLNEWILIAGRRTPGQAFP